MEASYEGGQGPEGAVATYMEWNSMHDVVQPYSNFLEHGI